jgi:hypothetical protein
MRQKGVLILLMPLIILMASTCISADKMTIDIRAWIDHYDTLYIDDTNHTLQWKYQGQWSPVGLEGYTWPNQAPMHVNISNPSMDQDWYIWTTKPTNGKATLSPALTIPDLPFEYIIGAVNLTMTYEGSGKPGAIIIEQLPSASNGFIMALGFHDDNFDGIWRPGANWYNAHLEITYNPMPPNRMLFLPLILRE